MKLTAHLLLVLMDRREGGEITAETIKETYCRRCALVSAAASGCVATQRGTRCVATQQDARYAATQRGAKDFAALQGARCVVTQNGARYVAEGLTLLESESCACSYRC